MKLKAKYKVQHYPNEVGNDIDISICVQTYNQKDYIGKCLDQILKQKTSFKYEILLGEDDSSDGTREICIEYANKYPKKIRLFLHDRRNNIPINNKPSGRFNFIYNLLQVKGDFFCFCEGDDYWNYDLKLEEQVNFLNNNSDCVLCFAKAYVLNETNNTNYKQKKPYMPFPNLKNHSKIFFKDLLMQNPFATNTVVLRKEIINRLDDNFIYKTKVGDWFLYLEALKNGKHASYLDKEMGVYRITDTGTWASLENINRLIYKKNIYHSFYDYFQLKGEEIKIVDNALRQLNKKIDDEYMLQSKGIYFFKHIGKWGILGSIQLWLSFFKNFAVFCKKKLFG